MAYDGPYKEPVVCGFLATRHLFGLAEVDVHPVVVYRDGLQFKVPHAVDLELKGEGWLQMAVDAVLRVLQTRTTRRSGQTLLLLSPVYTHKTRLYILIEQRLFLYDNVKTCIVCHLFAVSNQEL